MVQVAGLGLGKEGHGHTVQTPEAGNYFQMSSEFVIVSLVAILLTCVSCVGYFVCHCCPYVLPSKVRNFRDRIYRRHEKPKKFLPRQQFSDEQELFSVNYSSKSKGGFPNKPIPNIVISTVNEQMATNSSEGEFTEIPLEDGGKAEEIT